MRKILWLVAALDLYLQFVLRRQGRGVANLGISFGIGQGLGLWVALVGFGLFLIWFVLYNRRQGSVRIAGLMLALGGGTNLLARLLWGVVWDYVSISVLPFSFNLSDVLISAGVLSYILRVNENRSSVRGQRHPSD